eukprot:6182790-Pleurochrysis_carterae.AAC.7
MLHCSRSVGPVAIGSFPGPSCCSYHRLCSRSQNAAMLQLGWARPGREISGDRGFGHLHAQGLALRCEARAHDGRALDDVALLELANGAARLDRLRHRVPPHRLLQLLAERDDGAALGEAAFNDVLLVQLRGGGTSLERVGHGVECHRSLQLLTRRNHVHALKWPALHDTTLLQLRCRRPTEKQPGGSVLLHGLAQLLAK